MLENESLINIEDVCEILCVVAITVYRYCNTKGLPYHRIEEGKGNPYRFYKSEVLEWHNNIKPTK